MTTRRLIATAALVAASLFSANAQQQPTARPSSPAPTAATPSTGGAPAEVWIAIINTAFFGDEKQGIGRLVIAARGVDKEFEPRRTELRNIQTNLQGVADKIAKAQGVQEPRVTEQQREQAEKLKRELDFKTQEAQAAYTKRMQEVMAPISEDIGRTLDAFAKQRGYTLILDAKDVPILYALPSMDITRDFITEYNRQKPATAANTAPATR
ncbi:MAG: OmpH family outer membrane protein [Pyrinomonadaceae bacterium]|nr:OmpH family outer membrane protein [Pyrinomonadaceae bacterium]